MSDQLEKTEGTPSEPASPPGGPGDDVPACEETSSIVEPYFIHPDGGDASASQRYRLIPPDGRPVTWWVRHRKQILLAEVAATALFFLLSLYFLFLWITYNPFKVAADAGRWTQIVVHHTATAGGTPEGIDRYHRDVNKWENGLGYHFLIGNGNGMPDGQIHVGNRWLQQLNGAHVRMRGTDRANSFSIGIALVGNFDNTEATPKQMESLRRLLRFLLKEYGLRPEHIVGHNNVAANHTECPGKNFVIAELIESL